MSNSFARSSLTALVLAVFVLVPASAQTPQRGTGSADARLRALYTEEWNWRQQELGRGGDQSGGAGEGGFPRVDAASQQARLAYWTRTLTTLDSIPFDELSPEEKVNAQVFRTSIRALANDVRFRTYEAPFNSDTFFWAEFTPRQGFATAGAYRAFLGRLRGVPRYFDEQVANMRAGLARGFTVPRVSVVGRDETIVPYVKGDTTNPLYAPFTQIPATVPEAEQAAMRGEAATVIRDVVAPAYERLLTFMRTEYLPKARTTLAAIEMPDGEAYYQAMIEKFTTLDLTAKQIHEIGLKEVARIDAEMAATKERAGFKGTMAEFFHFLRTDPQFYARTPRELLSYSAYVSKKADWKLGETFGFLPRRRHGIRPVPEALAPIYTGGRGGLEACLMNTYNLPARPLYTLAALTLHECTPGHSFQAALALEGPERPRSAVQRRSPATAKGGDSTPSGWAPSWGSTRPPTRTSAGSPTKCGARAGSSSTRAFTSSGGPASRRWITCARARRFPSTRSRPRSSAISRGPDRPWPTSSVSCRSAGIVAKRRRSWAPSSTSDTSTTPSWRSARCRCRCWSSE